MEITDQADQYEYIDSLFLGAFTPDYGDWSETSDEN